MIRELVMFTLRCIIGLCLVGWGASALFADRMELQCRPVVVPRISCTPGGLNYNHAPIECQRS